MCQPNRFLHADGGYSLPTLAPRPMDYFKLSKRFWQLDSEQSFGASATRLYFFLLEEFNRDFWPEYYTLSDAQLCMALDMTANTLKKARQELTERAGLHCKAGQQGRNLKAVYSLSIAPNKVSKNDTYGTTERPNKVSDKVSENDGFPSNKVSDKVSKNDTLYKEETLNSSVVENRNEEVGREASSSPAQISEKKDTLPSESQSPVPGTEGGGARRPSPHADATQLTTADVAPLLNDKVIFKAACLDINPAYAGIDFEHYRLEMRFDSLDKALNLMPFEWRKRLRNWLTNAKSSRNGLILAPVAGQTKGDPRAIQPLAARSSASPTKSQSWS